MEDVLTLTGGKMLTRIVASLIPDWTTAEFLAVCITLFAYGISTDRIFIALWALGVVVVWFFIRFFADVGVWIKKNFLRRPNYSKN